MLEIIFISGPSVIVSTNKLTMKNIICFLLIELCIFNIICDEKLLSKFHQNDYKMKDIRIELKSYDKTYFNYAYLRSFKYNRTTVAVNLTFNAKQDMGNKVEVIEQAYKFLSNEYRKIAYRFQINVCKAYDANIVGIKIETSKCGNLTSCHFKKNVTYHVCNYVLDIALLPPFLPNGLFMVEHELLFEKTPMAQIISYCEVYRPIEYPKGNTSG